MGEDKPSWLRWPPNSCETCVSWNHTGKYTTAEGEVIYSNFVGICNSSSSFDQGLPTDARYRCPAFKRKAGV